jgi:hypothetical protein
MNATWIRAGLLALAVAGTTVSAGAQERPTPASSPSPPGVPTLLSVLRPEFHLSIEGETGYESNVRFLAVDPVGDMANRARADFVARTRLGRTSMVLNANGDLTQYRKTRDFNRWDYAYGADLGRALTARTSARASVRAMMSLTPVLDSGAVALAIGPLSRTRSYSASAGFSHRMSLRTSLEMGGNFRDVKYSVPGLAGGQQADATLGLQHRYGTSTVFGASLETSHTTLADLSVLSQSVVGNWSTAHGRMGYSLRAGARMLGGDSVRNAWVPNPLAEASVSRRLFSNYSAQVRGGYAVAPTLGVGSVLASQFVGAAIDRASPKGTGVRLSVDYSTSHDRGGVAHADSSVLLLRTPDLKSLSAGIDLRRNFGAATWVSANAVLRRSDALQRITSHVVGLRVGRRLF